MADVAERPISAKLAARLHRERVAMTDADIQNCLRAFALFDTEKRGTIRLCELKEVMSSCTGEVMRDEEVFEVRGRAAARGPRSPHHRPLQPLTPATPPRPPSPPRQTMCEANLVEGSEHVMNFGEFLRLMTERKLRINTPLSDDDLLEAYVACGGDADGGGCVNADILVRVIKNDFELAIDIQELIAAVDEDGSGEIEFDEVRGGGAHGQSARHATRVWRPRCTRRAGSTRRTMRAGSALRTTQTLTPPPSPHNPSAARKQFKSLLSSALAAENKEEE